DLTCIEHDEDAAGEDADADLTHGALGQERTLHATSPQAVVAQALHLKSHPAAKDGERKDTGKSGTASRRSARRGLDHDATILRRAPEWRSEVSEPEEAWSRPAGRTLVSRGTASSRRGIGGAST